MMDQYQCSLRRIRAGNDAMDSLSIRELPIKRGSIIPFLVAILMTLGAYGCGKDVPRPTTLDACALALAPHSGDGAIDREIIRLQETARVSPDASRVMEQLGWAYVQKSRISYDQGFYKLAEQCASCIESQHPESQDAQLLRGHVLLSLHRFKEAEAIARRLSETRSAPFDHALLGDALMEQGLLNAAISAYQRMVDLKPGPQAYTRIAHIRWLKGDLEGALEMMRKAAVAMSPRDAESSAWAYTRLALYELQTGSVKNADLACQAALRLQNDYAPAMIARSRILLAQNRNNEAAQLMRKAASINPLPEYKWVLAESLRAGGHVDEAHVVEEELMQRGSAEDPRTLSLFLANRREKLELAVTLVEREMKSRADVFTLDALAWALAAQGKMSEAQSQMNRALAEGTQDARLFYHAGAILAKTGRPQEARAMLNKAVGIKQMLLPSERAGLTTTLAGL
jgi:tetratricopeptide (TPR) repeat protein